MDVVCKTTKTENFVKKPTVGSCDSNEDGHIMRDLKQLSRLYSNISNDQMRIWLLRELLSRDLSTEDIFSFIKGQGRLRSDIRSLDHRTMTSAMRMKLLDLRKALYRKENKKSILEEKIYGDKKLIRERRKAFKKENRTNLRHKKEKYRAKISHYMKRQGEIYQRYTGETKRKKVLSTQVPSNMSEYKDLPIFKGAKGMPKAQKPRGPFICSKQI